MHITYLNLMFSVNALCLSLAQYHPATNNCSQFIFNILYTYIILLSATLSVLVLLVCKSSKMLNTSKKKTKSIYALKR